ncbi:MAG: DMT family transporter [Candidatus Accumulibacter sp.]|jgi:drug/metabolite transporter (DMT)-like permease|nr:DMT family transporter [Accumulibacter sp.]
MLPSPNRFHFSLGKLFGRTRRSAVANPIAGSNAPKGVLMVLTAVMLFSVTDSMAKYLTLFYPVSLIVWSRFAFHLLLVIVLLGPRYGTRLIRTKRPAEQVLRGLLLLMGSLFFIAALKFLPLAETTAIAYLSPLFVTLMSVVLLKEKVEPARWIAILCSFAGVLIIIRPGSGVFTWAALLPIANAVTFATYQIVTLRLARLESPYTSIFYAGLVGTLLLAGILPDVWVLPQTWGHALAFAVLGLFAALGHLILIKAYVHASAARLAPFSYTQLIWVAIIGFVVFRDFPDGWSLLGMAIVIASGVFMARKRHSVRSDDPDSRDHTVG